MKKPDNDTIHSILESFNTRRIAVIGDIMLDEYLWGRVQRISPEAPVPVVEIQKEEYRLGGAANVALNLASLGARVELVGICGKDQQARKLQQMLRQRKMSLQGIFEDDSRPTTLKTRIGASSQQIVRLDRELCDELDPALQNKIREYLKKLIPACDAVIIEDYDKGLLNATLISEILSLAKQNRIPVAVDPKQKNFGLYTGVDIFKPNFGEMQGYLNQRFNQPEDFILAAQTLQRAMQIKHLVVTRGSEGIYVFGSKGERRHLPSFAREVFDVSGAGDTVISALTLAYLYQSDIFGAALVANHAAAVVVAKHGTATATPAEIRESVHDLDQTDQS